MKMRTLLVAGVVLLGCGWAGWHFTRSKAEPPPPPTTVPVSAAKAETGSVPVMLPTIGAVQALNAVDVRPQVSGTLLDVPVKEGDLVKKGDVLAVIDPRPFKAALDKAEAQLAQDQAQLQNGQVDLGRYRDLAARDFASRQQLDTQTATVNRLQGVVAADRAAIEEAQINLDYCVLKAPLDGRVGLRRVDPGNLVQANSTGTGILSIVQDQPISVVFSLPEANLAQVRAAMKRGPVPVFADESATGAQLAAGTLLTPNNQVDASSGTIQMKANFDNPDLALTPGQFVGVRVQVAKADGVVVPHTAIMHGQDELFVFVVKPDDTTAQTKVKLAYDDGQHAVLASGLEAGSMVVSAGQTRIGNGTKVSYKKEGDAAPAAQQSAGK